MDEATSAVAEQRRDVRHTSGAILSGLSSGHGLFHWLSQSVLVLLPEIQSAFQLSAVGVGGILTVRELASGIATLPGGIITDMLRRHWGLLLAICIGGLSLGSLVIGLSPIYPLVLVGMALMAVAHSIWHLPASASLSYYFPQRRGMALSFHGVGGSVGDVIGPVATGALLAVLSWRGLLSVYAVAPLLLAFVAFWALKDVGRAADAESKAGEGSDRRQITMRLLRRPDIWWVTLVRGFRSMALVGLLTSLPLYLGVELGLSPFARGFHIGLLIAIGIVAKPAMGYLSDRIGRKQVLVPGLLWSCGVSLLLIPYGQGFMLPVLIVLLGLFLYPDQPILTATVLDIVEPDVATTALGIGRFVSFLMSAASPIAVGFLYQSYGLTGTLYYVAGLFLAGAIALSAAKLVPANSTT